MNPIYSPNDSESRKTRAAVTFIKYLASGVSLIILAKTLIWNKFTFSASNSLNLQKSIYKKIYKYFFFYLIYHCLM